MITEHLAAKPEGLVQMCARCGSVLVDNHGAMAPAGHEGEGPGFWAEGPVFKSGSMWSISNCWEGTPILCAGAGSA